MWTGRWPSGPLPGRPDLALRVGVTGARCIAPGREPGIRQQIRHVLRLASDNVRCLARTRAARDVYAGGGQAGPPARLCLLSPLAEGADRLAAREALDAGYHLFVPMPFPRGEYAKDFAPDPGPSDRVGEGETSFDALLGQAVAALELDGARDDPAAGHYQAARSYEAVGRFVVRNCDLLIAVWDGEPSRGWGGSAEIVRYAANFGPPVWWIDAAGDLPPRWIAGPSDLHDAPAASGAEQALGDYLHRLILPPDVTHVGGHHSLLDRMVEALHCRRDGPLQAYFREPVGQPRMPWSAHRRLLDIASCWRQPRPPPARAAPVDPVVDYWRPLYRAADDRAEANGARFRSVYVWTFGLIAATVIAAAAALAFPASELVEWACVGVELAALLFILFLVIANLWQDWHQRWIDYRLLAELCRKQQALAPLGWTLPARSVATLAEEAGPGAGRREPDRAAWVAWLFGAYVRAAPPPHGAYNAATLDEPRQALLRDLVHVQRRYHRDRRIRYTRASRHFAIAGEVLFFAVFVIAGWKLGSLWHARGPLGPSPVRGLLAVILPTIGAAAVGIRAYAELQLLARQSDHMQAVMRRAAARLARLPLDTPLASQELGAIAVNVATLMLQDVDGWARAFRVKVVEAG